MQDTMKHIKVNDIEYPLVFNLNVMEKIQEKYGTIERWGDLTDGKSHEVNITALKFGILEMINEGIDIENETKGTERAFVTSKQVGRITTELGVDKMSKVGQEIVIDSTKIEEEEKNV